jgi:hypothetical protein
MTYYELYINDILCDLSSDNYISLVYQSPIFSGLDIIQSNRSYNIDLPLTPKNRKAIGYAERTDIYTDAPYVKLPARLYQEGVPLFTSGYAVITEISDVISVVLTWGNVDNFQPLFDANLRDLAQTLYSMNIGSIPWNSASALLEYGYERPQMGFFGIDFGQGIANPEYMHPSIEVQDVLTAIERYNGITIDGKERLYGGLTYPLLLPLVSKNGDDISGAVDYFEASRIVSDGRGNRTSFESNLNNYIVHDPKNIYMPYDPSNPSMNGTAEFQTLGASHMFLSINPNTTGDTFNVTCRVSGASWRLKEQIHVIVKGGGKDILKISSAPITITSGMTSAVYTFYTKDFPKEYEINTDSISNISIQLKDFYNVQSDGAHDIILNWSVKLWGDIEMIFPSEYPIGVNLPDISQGDFLSALMSMAGLFAYPDKDAPDTIKLISVDDIYAKLTNGGTIDWSRKVILNDRHDVSRPESSIFSLDDLAQKNTLDYDNDDDVITDTAGEIRIENVNIDKENELVELPFSASENAPLASDANALCARIPMYTTSDDGKTVDYNEPSARILQAIIDDTSTGLYWFGYFGENMRFGGENGIVAKKYNGYQKAVDKLRLITVKAKLTAIDLHNLDYTKPIYIGQFGQTYGLYSVETGENGICECQLIQLQAIKEVVIPDYYLTINGSASDISRAVGSNKTVTVFTYQTNGSLQISSQSGMFENIAFAHGILSIGVKENTTTSSRSGNLIASLKEAPAIIRTITVQQAPAEPEPAASRPLKLHLMVTDNEGAPLAADEVTVTTKNAAGQTVTREYTNTSAVDDTIADIPTSGSSVTVTASKSGYNDGWIQGSIPSGSSDYTYTGVVPLRSSRMISAEVRVQDAGGSAVVAEEIACTYLQSSGKTNTMLATNSSILDDRGHSDCSVKAFTSRITVTAADYNTAVEEVPVEAGSEAVTIRKTVTLYPGSRSLHLDFAVRNEQGAAVEDAVVVIQYVKPDGSDENLQFTGGVHETFDNATTQGFTLLIMAQAEGSRVHMQQIAVPAGKEAYTYDTDVVLYYDYSPGITLDPPSPWTYAAHLGTLRNTGNVDLELLSAPEWCTITGDIPGTVAVGEGRAFAVSKNETGDLRKGTISMQWHNIEASETTAYDVEVSQEP